LLGGRLAFFVLGLLILLFGLLQNYAGFAQRAAGAAGSWFSSGGASIVTGLLLIVMPKLTFAGLALLLGLSWMVGGASRIASAVGRRDQPDWYWSVADGAVNAVLGLGIALQWPVEGVVSIGLAVGLRCISAGWSLLVGAPRVTVASAADAAGLHPDERLGLAPHSYVGALREELAAEELIRSRGDRSWCWLFLFTFFVIHAARMDTDWNLVGMLSPAGAVVGTLSWPFSWRMGSLPRSR